ncbi:MAG TPA: hypothetical protein VJ246_00045 [Patescibacteria group bacterium]|nr:hypothetical protein [Patescibacteria group bacterium]
MTNVLEQLIGKRLVDRGMVDQRLSEVDKTPFSKEQAEALLDEYFTLNPDLGRVQGKVYLGYFLDPFGNDYHAFGVNVSDNRSGFSEVGAMVSRGLIDASPNLDLFQQALENARKLT